MFLEQWLNANMCVLYSKALVVGAANITTTYAIIASDFYHLLPSSIDKVLTVVYLGINSKTFKKYINKKHCPWYIICVCVCVKNPKIWGLKVKRSGQEDCNTVILHV